MAGLLEDAPAAYAGMALASDDLDSDIERLRGQGAPISDPVAGERARPDGDVVRWRIGRLPEPDPDLGLVFLIEHDTSVGRVAAGRSRGARWARCIRSARAAGSLGSSCRSPTSAADTAPAASARPAVPAFARRPRRARHDDRQPAPSSHSLRGRPRAADCDPRGPRAQEAELLGCRWVIDPVYARRSEVAAQRLLALDRLEQRLEVADAEAARAVALDDLEEERRPILDRAG